MMRPWRRNQGACWQGSIYRIKRCTAWIKKNIEWADLIVTLDEAADLACPRFPASVQKRCYPFPQPENMEDLRGVRDAIQQRVEDMIGGMRMMNRFV